MTKIKYLYFICCIEGVRSLVLFFEMLYVCTSPRDSRWVFLPAPFPLVLLVHWFNNIDMLMTFPEISKICFIIFAATSVGVCDGTISSSAFIPFKMSCFSLKIAENI